MYYTKLLEGTLCGILLGVVGVVAIVEIARIDFAPGNRHAAAPGSAAPLESEYVFPTTQKEDEQKHRALTTTV